MSDLQRCHGDVNDRLKRLVDEDGPVKRIVDPCEKKAQVEVNEETLGVTKDLGMEGGGGGAAAGEATSGEATSGESPRRRDAEASHDSTRARHRWSYSAWRTSKSR